MIRAVALALLVTGVLIAQAPAVPLDPVTAIVDAFRTHEIVALAEGRHNNDQGHAFRLALVRDPRFAAAVNDIVVESGSAKHQDVMDRFIRGESVPDLELRRAWQDTTAPDPVWDVPMYEEFFRAVRTVNQSLPPDRRLRVLLGDPPFEWEGATREDVLGIASERDSYPAALIQRAVLAKKRRALLVYGDGHIARHPPLGGGNITTRLAASAVRIFTIWTHTSGADLATIEASAARWPVPALAMTRGTTLGAAPFSAYRGFRGPGDSRMEEEYDAVLYVGPLSSITVRRGEISRTLCADAEYMAMRLRRMQIMDPPGAVPPPGVQSPTGRLEQHCAKP
jgi:hypothetical protein